MFVDFVRKLEIAEDKFAFVLSDPLLHKVSADPELLERYHSAISFASLSDDDLRAVKLANLFATRRYIDLRALPWQELIERCSQSLG